MSDIQTGHRISEKPENYESVFQAAIDTAQAVRNGGMEPREADSIAKNLSVAQRQLDGDLKARAFEHRTRMREVARSQQLEGPKAAA